MAENSSSLVGYFLILFRVVGIASWNLYMVAGQEHS